MTLLTNDIYNYVYNFADYTSDGKRTHDFELIWIK